MAFEADAVDGDAAREEGLEEGVEGGGFGVDALDPEVVYAVCVCVYAFFL